MKRISRMGSFDESRNRERPSKNLDKDKKLVFDIAHRMLFEIPDKYKQEEEYYLLLNELKRGVTRIHTFRGFTPATEAELALSLFLAHKALGEEASEARQRLEKAASKLKDTSKLKAQCLEFLKKFKG